MRKIPRPHVSTFPRGLLIALLGLCLLSGAARAANQTVTSLANSGAGSLREAIALVGIGETINFAVTGTIELTSGKLLITDHLTIIGPGALLLTVTRKEQGTTPYPVFSVTGGANVNISGLSITKGGLTAGVSLDSSTLTLQNCALTNNSGFESGGIENIGGTLTVRNCLISGNRSFRGSYSRDGGGIHSESGTTVVENSTFFGNIANRGGGIFQNGGNLTVTHCTFAANFTGVGSAGAEGNCIMVQGGAVLNLANTILQSDSGDSSLGNLSSTINSSGYNLCSDSGSGFLTAPGDKINTDPKLDPAGLQNNGGPTLTLALLSDSPAVDQGKSFGFTTDQRGQLRPRDLALVPNAVGSDASDIGAFEAVELPQLGLDFIVTTTDDHDDGIAGVLDCTLREALRVLNSSGEAGTITFAAGVTGTIALQSALGQLNVTNPVTLAGPGARKLALSGENGARPILFFAIGSSGSAVSGLTLRDAQRLGAFVDGAGLVNLGTLTVADCAFVNNIARALSGSQPGQTGGDARGGGIFNGGTLTLRRCTFSGNRAWAGNSRGNSVQFAFGPGGGAGLGAAVFNDTSATLTADNCTFWSNYGQGGDGANNTGAGSRDGNGGRGFGTVFNQGTMTLTSCTLALNLGIGGAGGFNDGAPGPDGGGFATSAGTCTVRNTISVYNTATSGPDAFGAFTSQGWNLLGKSNGSTGFTATGDQTGSSAAPLNAGLGLFQNNGGPTDTFLLLAGSPAIDKGRAFSLGTDQLNLPRRYDDPALPNASGGDGTDIGAVEMQPNYSGPLKVLSLTLVGPTARVMIQGTNFLNYQLQKTDSLGTPVADLGAAQTADSIGQTEFTDFGPLPARRFYRARQAP